MVIEQNRVYDIYIIITITMMMNMNMNMMMAYSSGYYCHSILTCREEKPITFTIQNIVSQYTHSFEEFRQYMTFKYMVK